MHGRTFSASIVGLPGTIWDREHPSYGECGVIKAKGGDGKKGRGWVMLILSDGNLATVAFDKVALGDNSIKGE